jgi:hypothetical protein
MDTQAIWTLLQDNPGGQVPVEPFPEMLPQNQKSHTPIALFTHHSSLYTPRSEGVKQNQGSASREKQKRVDISWRRDYNIEQDT